MSKIISYKGKLNVGTEDRIKLSTINGKQGYKIHKFQVISTVPGTTDTEMICKIFNKSQEGTIGPTVDFTDSELLAVAYDKGTNNLSNDPMNTVIIFDNKKFNQDIFVTLDSANSSTTPFNYYIELETMPISDLEATYLSLQNIKTITN